MPERSFTEGLVSVVTPVWNGEEYIGRLLESVLKQTWKQLEMIVVDDGSTDATIAVAESFAERFAAAGMAFSVIANEHSCAAGAVREGLKHVSGEFLIWPDGDDELEPESVEMRVRFLRNNPDINMVRSLSRYVNETDGSEASRDEQVGDLSTHRLFFDILEGRTFVCCGCYMLRSPAFFALYPDGGIPVYPVGQNFQMLLPISYHHVCATIEESLYNVYVRDSSHSRRELTREQEETKYRDYELLLDDIVRIAGITQQSDLNRIEIWKQERRLQLSEKYGNNQARRAAVKQLYRLGAVSRGTFLRKYAGSMLGGFPGRLFKTCVITKNRVKRMRIMK